MTESCENTARDIVSGLEAQTKPVLIYVTGSAGTGKTTLCSRLRDLLLPRGPVAVIDADPGQSSIGPPACVGMRVFHQGGHAADEKLAFVGSASPTGHMLQLITGMELLTNRARSLHIPYIVLDSSGFILGNPALEFQFNAIRILAPGTLAALQKKDELDPLLACFQKDTRLTIVVRPPDPKTRNRSSEERRAHRTERWTAYFRDAVLHTFSWRSFGIHGQIPDFTKTELLRHRIFALLEPEGFVRSLGIVHSVDARRQLMQFHAPEFDIRQVASLQFGTMKIAMNGMEK